MKKIVTIILLLSSLVSAQELKIKADLFKANENKGISVFQGNVNIVKKNDVLDASKVTIYTNKKNKPTKFVAEGNVSFKIETKQHAKYEGTANKVIFIPKNKEYYFYENVHLKQVDDKKEIKGEEVILNINDGKAYAKGQEKEPVIMIFDISDDKE